MAQNHCCICKSKLDLSLGNYKFWRTADPRIDLPKPPKDIVDPYICCGCYVDGPTMEARIRAAGLAIAPRIYAADGSDGLNCIKCLTYYSYVESNCAGGGYQCPECRKY